MANEVGTANDLEDLFGKIVSFLTTNAALVSAGQQWTVNRQYRDGLAGYTTNLTETTTAQYRKINHSFRYTPRTLNTNSTINQENYTYCYGYVAGTSYIAMTLRSAQEIKNVRIISANHVDTNYTLSNFLLQYSDNNSTWTTALTVSSSPSYQMGEQKDFAVPGSPGSHLYWRILINSANGASSIVTWKSMLLQLADGTIANHFGSEVLLKSTGTSGTDNIYTGIRSEYDSSNGWYNLFLCGFTGYNSNVLDFFLQPGCINGYADATPMMIPMVPCWNSSMPYWFAANGRSFRFGVKVSTSFESGYMGFILPYASPSQYPYPLAIGGSLIPQNSARGLEWRYSYNNYRHSVYTCPATNNIASVTSDSTLYLRMPDGSWRSFGQRSNNSDPNHISRAYITSGYPLTWNGPSSFVYPTANYSATLTDGVLPYREVLGGGYMLIPFILAHRYPTTFACGELEGIYQISGFSNASENTFTYNSENHVILQNISRTETHEYFSMSLP